MTEFITRNHGNKDFEVIIKTDSKEHYKQTEDFARRLIDHAKPQTNADRCVCCGAEIPEGRQVCPECMEKGKDKPCAWCKAEYTIIDDDFGQPVHPTKVKFCFNCGRRLR